MAKTQDGPVFTGMEPMPKSSAEAQKTTGYGSWSNGWLMGESSGNMAAAFGSPLSCTEMVHDERDCIAEPSQAQQLDDAWQDEKTGERRVYRLCACLNTETCNPDGVCNLCRKKAAIDLSGVNWHITMAGGHCGDAACTKCDPLERYVGGLTVAECLERYEANQRGDTLDDRGRPALRYRLTSIQLDAARTAWSDSLRAKQQQAREKERVAVVVDDDRWEP